MFNALTLAFTLAFAFITATLPIARLRGAARTVPSPLPSPASSPAFFKRSLEVLMAILLSLSGTSPLAAWADDLPRSESLLVCITDGLQVICCRSRQFHQSWWGVGASGGCFPARRCQVRYPFFSLCIGDITLLLIADSATFPRSFLGTEGFHPHHVDVHGIRIPLTSQLRSSESLMPASGGIIWHPLPSPPPRHVAESRPRKICWSPLP
jgi:hypothetical protein